MANKIRFWETEELKKYNLLDITARYLPGKQEVEVKCNSCETVSKLKFSILLSKMHTYGLKWRCISCLNKEKSERGRTLTKENNPFYKKTHSRQTRNVISQKNKEKWSKVPQEEINRIMITTRKIAYEQYGGNPMLDESIRKKHKDAITSFFNDEAKVIKRQEKLKQTNLKKYGNEYFLCSEYYDTNFNKFKSKAEQEIQNILTSWGISSNKRRKDNIEIDVFLSEKNIGIEMNGCYFHSELFRDKNYHLRKTEYCEINNIKLIQIFDHEWSHKRSQVLGFLKSAMGLNTTKINGRECDVVELESKEAKEFLATHHIQGGCIAQIYLGLVYKGEIVAVGAFGYHHRKNNIWVLKRFAVKGDVTVIGGLSKISKHASKIIKQDIISWCDRRWSNGNGYLKSGWVADAVLPPDYFYIKNGRYFCSKQARRKKAVNTKDMTEKEHAKLDGLFRVYDCGKIRFIYKYSEN